MPRPSDVYGVHPLALSMTTAVWICARASIGNPDRAWGEPSTLTGTLRADTDTLDGLFPTEKVAIMRILIVQDDPDSRHYMHNLLRSDGYVSDVVADGGEALECAGQGLYDALLLDWSMPKIDGLTILKTLRKESNAAVVIMVCQNNDEYCRLAGLDAGADDYVSRPFQASELLARLRNAIRRAHGGIHLPGAVLTTGDLEMDLLQRRARRGTRMIEFTKLEFDLLECFVRQPRHVLSYEVLEQRLFDNASVWNTSCIQVHISHLRKKLGSRKGHPFIRTVRGCGYALEA